MGRRGDEEGKNRMKKIEWNRYNGEKSKKTNGECLFGVMFSDFKFKEFLFWSFRVAGFDNFEGSGLGGFGVGGFLRRVLCFLDCM